MNPRYIINDLLSGGYRHRYRVFNAFNPKNKWRIPKGNQVICDGALLRNVDIQVTGAGNQIVLNDRVNLTNCSIRIYGNNNKIMVGAYTTCNQTTFWIENENNLITIGEYCRLTGKTELATIEGTEITIGNRCLFSNHITFRTGDSHSIVDLQGKRCNPSESIAVHDHVWIGADVICLKGTEIAEGCVVGTRALVTKKFIEPHCIIAGTPAKIIRRETTWIGERIPLE